MNDNMVSIVIPFFNEEKRLKSNLNDAINRLSTIVKQPLEIIFVNDGSKDNTKQMLLEEKKSHPDISIEIIGYPDNQGKGHAVKTGVLHSKGDKVVVMDADFSIDIDETDRFLDQLGGYDVVIGSKKHLLTQSIKHQKIPRRILGKGFTMLTDLIFGLRFTDITCGFKAFKAAAAKDLFSRLKMKSWSYDAETLFLARKYGYKTLELPVKWIHIEGSKVSPIIDTFKTLKDLISILFNYYTGKYGR